MASDIVEAVVPCLAFGSILLIVLGFAAFMRYMRYKETVALAEKGLLHPKQTRRNGRDSLRWGVIIIAVGLALCVGLYPFGFITETQFPLRFGPWMLIGLIPSFFGLGLIVVYWLTRKDDTNNSNINGGTTTDPSQSPPEGEPESFVKVHREE